MEHKKNGWVPQIAVFDLETTGIDIDICRIVTAYVGVLDASGRVLAKRRWLVDPGIEIPTAAALIHGVTTERARAKGKPAVTAVAQIVQLLSECVARGLPLVAYNASYDLTLLAREAERYGLTPLVDPYPVIDPLVIDKQVDPDRRGKRTLTSTAAHYGVTLENAHDSGADAVAAGRVALALVKRNPGLAKLHPGQLHRRQIIWASDQALRYQAWRRQNGEPEFTTSVIWPVH